VPNGKGATLIQLLVDHGFSLVRSLVASCYDSVVTSRYVMIQDGGKKESTSWRPLENQLSVWS
jgi:hypothetical protein